LLLEGYVGLKVTETNVNALPTAKKKQLRHHAFRSAGERIAINYLSNIQPRLAIVHGADVASKLRSSGILSHGNARQQNGFVADYSQASWNGKPCRLGDDTV
jgi:hypothetical protein